MISFILICIININYISAEEMDIIDDFSDSLKLDEMVDIIDNTIENSDFKDVISTDDLVTGNYIQPKTLFSKILQIVFNELYNAVIASINILIIVVIISILKTFELEKNSEIIAVANFVCYIAVSTILLDNFVDILNIFKSTITSITTIVQIASPFLMGVLIATGSVTVASLAGPLILFAVSAISFVISFVVVPLIIISVAFNIVHSLNENLGLAKLR